MALTGAIVRITSGAFDALQQGARAAHDRRKETCFVLFGRDGTITQAIRAGEPEEHAAMTRPDFAAADATVQEMREQGFQQFGQAHVHLGYPGPSSGDIRTLREDAPTDYLCVVVNVTGDRPADLTCHSVDEQGNVIEHAIEIVAERAAYEPLIPAERRNIGLVQFGLGTGGAPMAHHAALWQLARLTFVDHDQFEARNAQRHYVAPRAAKRRMKKTRWAREFVAPRTTATVQTIARKITPQNRSWLSEVIRDHDMAEDCTGHPVARRFISETCKALHKPLVSAGVFEKASGGFVFLQGPNDDDACVAGCLFKLTRHTRSDDRATLDQLARDYGMTEDQLEAQQGLFTDVSMIAALQAKVTLEFLKGVQHPANLYLVDNQNLTLRKAFVQQSTTCTICHPDLNIPF